MLSTEVKQKIKTNTYKIRAFDKIKDIVYLPKNLLNIIEIYLDQIRDEELRDFVTLGTGINVPYPEGWTVELGRNLIKQVPDSFKMATAEAFLQTWTKGEYKQPFPGMIQKRIDLYFVVDTSNDEIIGMFNFKEEEYKLSGFALMGLRGDKYQRRAGGLLLIKFWNDIYAKILYDRKIRWVFAIGWTKKNREYIERFTKVDKRNGKKSGFMEIGIAERIRINDNISTSIRYQYDLWKKFGEPEWHNLKAT